MEKRKEKRILIFVACFYVAASILAVCILNLSGSIFAKRGEMDLPTYLKGFFGKSEQEVVESYNEINPEDKIQGLDALDNDFDEDDAEDIAEGMSLEAAQEEPSEQPTEIPTEEPSEAEPPEPVEPIEPEEHYYSFKTNNTDTKLRMRAEPDENAKIVYELKPGSTGYVIELGDDWSKVSAYGHEGYCANEFLTMTEISEEEYDEVKEASDNAASSKKSTQTADPAQTVNTAALPVDQTVVNAAAADPAAQTATGTAASNPSEDP